MYIVVYFINKFALIYTLFPIYKYNLGEIKISRSVNMILPICKEKTFKSYPYCSDYLSVANNFNDNLDLFMIYNYFNIKYQPIKGRLDFKYRSSLKSKMNYEVINDISKLTIEHIKKYIKNKKYIEVVLNLKKLEKNGGFLFPDFHNYLIYGYDNDTQKLFLLGYINKNNCKYYEKFSITYDEYNSALPKSGQKTGIENDIMSNHIFSYDNFIDEKLDKNYLLKNILEYNMKKNIFNNVDIYLCLITHIQIYSFFRISYKNRSLLDSRDFRVLFEHIQLLKKIVNILDLKDVQKQLEQLVKDSQSLLLLATRYKRVVEFKRKKNLEKLSINKLFDMWKNERNILNILCNLLS